MKKGFPSTSNDDYQLNTTTLIKAAARNFPEREIVSGTGDEKFRYNYGEAFDRIRKLGTALENIGIEEGDRVGVLAWNDYRHYEIYFGIPGIGAVFLMLNLRLHPEQLSYVINHAEPKAIIVDETLLKIAEAVAQNAETVEDYIIMTDRELEDVETNLESTHSYEALLEEATPKYDWPMIDETSAYGACYTTGTTGKPKGMYYSHRCIYLHSLAIAQATGLTFEDVFAQMVPMFHAQGWGTPQAATLAGSKLVLPGRYSAEEPGPLVNLFSEENVTITDGAPAIFMPMLNYIRKMEEPPDWEGLRMLSGASEPPLDMMKGFKKQTGAEVVHAYGATETTPLVTINYIKPSLEEKLSEEERWELKKKQGLTVPGLETKLVDPDTGEEAPHDGETPGELFIKGPWIASSYYDDPRTEESFTEDGFWKSGDMSTIDKEGYMKITDRIKDVIKSGGEWISTVDMENKIVEHPKVREAAVVGLEHPKWEERPFALIGLEKGAEVEEEEIYNLLKEEFADWQLPDEVEFVEEVPKTSVGKYDKKEIRGQYQGRYL